MNHNEILSIRLLSRWYSHSLGILDMHACVFNNFHLQCHKRTFPRVSDSNSLTYTNVLLNLVGKNFSSFHFLKLLSEIQLRLNGQCMLDGGPNEYVRNIYGDFATFLSLDYLNNFF